MRLWLLRHGQAGPYTKTGDHLRELTERGRREQNLLLVTHQPLVGALAGLLVYGHLQQPLPFNTASLALLEGEMPLAGLMNLLAIHHPPSHC